MTASFRRPQIGLGLQSDKAPGEYAELARAAETAGIDVVSVFSDLMYQPPLPALLEIAAATTAVRLGPACLNPYSMHPFEIAGQIACLDLASEGRAYLGLARGAWLDAVGIAQPNPVAAVGDAAAIVAALLRGDRTGYHGRCFDIAPGTTLRYDTYRPAVPLLVGAWGPRLGELAGRIADEVKVGGSANPAMVGVMRDRLAVGCRSVERDVDDVGIVLGAVCVVDEDGDAARALARTEVAMYLAVVAELDPTVEVPAETLELVRSNVAAGDHRRAGQAIGDDVLDRFAFSGTPEHVAAQVGRILDAGAARVELGTPHGLTAAEGVRLICSRVMPLIDRSTGPRRGVIIPPFRRRADPM